MASKKTKDTALITWIIILLSPIFGLLVMNIFQFMSDSARRFANIIGLTYFIILMIKFSSTWYFPVIGLINLLLK